MQLKAKTQEALDAWLGASTWHTSHSLDMDRWYRFVDQYERDGCGNVDEASLRERIEHKLGGVGQELSDVIAKRISLMVDILDFLRLSGR